MSLRIGILGAGKVALDHAEAILKLGHQVAAGCTSRPDSPNWTNFKRAIPNAEFLNGDTLLAHPQIDAVVACVSWSAIPDWLPRLLASPKPVLIEKPLGLELGAVEQAQITAQVTLGNKLGGYNRRYYQSTAKLKQRLEQGGLVSAQLAISEKLEGLVRKAGREALKYVFAYSSSSHILDLALHLLGPLTIERVFSRPEPGYEPFCNINALLTTNDNHPVMLSVHCADPIVVGITCRFDDHTIWQLGPVERLNIYRGYHVVEPSAESKVRRYTPKVIETVKTSTELRPGFLEQMGAFLSGKFGPGHRPYDTVILQKLIEGLTQTR
jgi:hypothetical protein